VIAVIHRSIGRQSQTDRQTDMAARFAKRLQKELKDLQTNPPEGITLVNCNELDRYQSLSIDIYHDLS